MHQGSVMVCPACGASARSVKSSVLDSLIAVPTLCASDAAIF